MKVGYGRHNICEQYSVHQIMYGLIKDKGKVMKEFITNNGETLIAFTDESLMFLAERGVVIYALFKKPDGEVVVRQSSTKLVWDKNKESYLSFFSRIYPMLSKNCIGLFYNKTAIIDLGETNE